MNKKVIVIGDSCESKVVQNIIIESGEEKEKKKKDLYDLIWEAFSKPKEQG